VGVFDDVASAILFVLRDKLLPATFTELLGLGGHNWSRLLRWMWRANRVKGLKYEPEDSRSGSFHESGAMRGIAQWHFLKNARVAPIAKLFGFPGNSYPPYDKAYKTLTGFAPSYYL
jgi:hypothetical protein